MCCLDGMDIQSRKGNIDVYFNRNQPCTGFCQAATSRKRAFSQCITTINNELIVNREASEKIW